MMGVPADPPPVYAPTAQGNLPAGFDSLFKLIKCATGKPV